MTEGRPTPEGLHARIADAEHVMADEIMHAMLARAEAVTAAETAFSASVTAAMHKRGETVAAAIAESDEALRAITALYHGRAAVEMPNGAGATAEFAGAAASVEGGGE